MCQIFGEFDILVRQLGTLASRRRLVSTELYDAAHLMSVLVGCIYDVEPEMVNAKDNLLTKREVMGDPMLGMYAELLGTCVVVLGSTCVTIRPHRNSDRASRISAKRGCAQVATPTVSDGAADVTSVSEGDILWIFNSVYSVTRVAGLELHLDRQLSVMEGQVVPPQLRQGNPVVSWVMLRRDSPSVDKDMQRLLRNMSAHRVVVQLLRLQFAEFAKPAELELRQMILSGA